MVRALVEAPRWLLVATLVFAPWAYGSTRIWAVLVDLVVVGMLFWVASGLWMWWEIKPARGWGAACALTGFGVFGILLATL